MIKSGTGWSASFIGWIRRHRWPIVGAVALLVTGMMFSFWSLPFVHHSNWFTPPDLWSTFRTAQYVGWGFEGEIYKSHTYFDSFPGIAVLLAPVAKLSGVLHMSESFPLPVFHPTAWLILGPTDFVLGGVLLFPLDDLARRLTVPRSRRVTLTWLEAALIWPIVVIWGHPEYSLALAFGIYGLLASLDGKWLRVGIFMGLAILFQPFTALMLPVVILCLPSRRWLATFSIVSLPSVLLLIPPLVKEWSSTTFTLLRQPNYPSLDHPTPWSFVAPILQRSHRSLTWAAEMVTKSNGQRRLTEVRVGVVHGAVISAGPGRILALLLAGIIGVYVAKSKPKIEQIVWWVAASLALRCVFECVMNPYYLLPGLAIVIVLASKLANSRLIITTGVVAACTLTSYRFMGAWPYYIVVVGTLLTALIIVWPNDVSPSEVVTHERPALSSR